MFKNILKILIGFYIVITATYFIEKYMPYLEKIIESKKQKNTQEIDQDICPNYAIGHIAMGQVRVYTRFFKNLENIIINENNLSESIAKQSCDRANQEAIIFYNSIPIGTAKTVSYDYSKSLAKDAKEDFKVYTIMEFKEIFHKIPDGQQIIAIYDSKKDTNTLLKEIKTTTEDDEEVIVGNSDTIYFEFIKEDPYKKQLEYSSIKTDLNNDGIEDLVALTEWSEAGEKKLRYISIFVLINKKDKPVKRYILFPITLIRNSSFYLSQVLDTNGDGNKEIIIKKTRDSIDEFTIYKYDNISDTYLSKSLN
jgi:hypothetical protein